MTSKMTASTTDKMITENNKRVLKTCVQTEIMKEQTKSKPRVGQSQVSGQVGSESDADY